ncbi:hypothetical protein [Ottowia thiooxydans]|uniref:Uncharacterized protein n=1 Tax=Ottowia thiooxydans TaxID=219182 RepID=A0ABV2QHE1_9BURK
MSGPKVVRVVTREELVAQGESLLARLDQALNIWRRQCAQFGQITEQELTNAVSRRDALETLLRADQFQAFSKGANNEIGYLQSDVETRRQAAIEAKARERARDVSGRQNAKALAKALRAKAGVDANLIAELEGAATGNLSIAAIDQLLAKGIQLLSNREGKQLTEGQRQLAGRLGAGETTQTLEQWKANQIKVDSRQEALLKAITELAMLGDVGTSEMLNTHLASLLQSGDTTQYAMRMDSLLIDARNAKTAFVAAEQAIKELQLVTAEFSRAGIDAASWQAKVDLATQQRSVEPLRLLADEGRNELSQALRSKTALARRQAVLLGLAKLGYSVQEGMSTTLAQDGRLVIKKPDMPGYGVEVAGGAANERFQVRAVALSASRDMTRDLDAESRWCQDFTNLQAELRVNGDELVIEKALPVGAVPLRVIETEVAKHTVTRTATPIAKGRHQ